jgi:hypothetical protein
LAPWVSRVSEGNQGGSAGAAGANFCLAGWVHHVSDSASGIKNLISFLTWSNLIKL